MKRFMTVAMLLLAVSCFAQVYVSGSDTDVANWRQNSGVWGKQTFTNYNVIGADTAWIGPFMVWPFQAVNITIEDTAAVDVDSVNISFDFYQWPTNDTSKAVIVGVLEFKSHWSSTLDSTLTGIGTYSAILGSTAYFSNQHGWLRMRSADGQKKTNGILITTRTNGWNGSWGVSK